MFGRPDFACSGRQGRDDCRRRHQDFCGFRRTGQRLDNALGFGYSYRRGGPPRRQTRFCPSSNQEGIEIALQCGVDILAHTTPSGGPWSSSLVARLKAAHVPLIPSLTLGHVESKNESPEEFEKAMNKVVVPELQAYSAAGGQVLFGTDVDYIEQFDTSEPPCHRSIIGRSRVGTVRVARHPCRNGWRTVAPPSLGTNAPIFSLTLPT
jgi:hypothetical protein